MFIGKSCLEEFSLFGQTVMTVYILYFLAVDKSLLHIWIMPIKWGLGRRFFIQMVGMNSWTPQYSAGLFDREEPLVSDIPTLHPLLNDPSHIWQYKLIKIPDKPFPFMQQRIVPAFYGLTRQLNYMSRSMCMCLYAVILTTASLVMYNYPCIKNQQISVPNLYLCVCVHFALQECSCLYMHVEGSVFCVKGGHRGAPRSAVCRLLSLRGGRVGVWGHVGPVCGNPVLLTSHTLFSCSYKPLMPQKMLSLLWPGTAEGGGNWGGGRIGRRGLA